MYYNMKKVCIFNADYLVVKGEGWKRMKSGGKRELEYSIGSYRICSSFEKFPQAQRIYCYIYRVL